MHKKIFFGALRSPEDERDYQFKSIPGAASPVLPYHSKEKDHILDQGASSQCGPCAITAARYETEHLQTGWTKNLSHTYVYGSDSDYSGEGMYMRTLMKIACAGIPYTTNWESWGNKERCKSLCMRYTTPQIKDEAYKLRGSSYYSCSNWAEVCNAARVTRGSVVILVSIYSNWMHIGKDGIVGYDSGEYYGNHFLRVKDYEILPDGVLKVRCQNSWGTNWGDGGYCYLLSDRNMFIEAMTVVDDINEVVRKLNFNDVADDRWSAEAINWCADSGIMSGFEDGTFRPEEPVTREQLASVLYRLAETADKV